MMCRYHGFGGTSRADEAEGSLDVERAETMMITL